MTNSNPFLTRDQHRAQHALSKVREVPSQLRSEYQTIVKGFSATIVTNGLGQACAMLLAKAENKDANKSAHRRLYEHLSDWLLKEAKVYPDDAEELIDAVIGHGQPQYIRAQAESLAYLEWLKKFAQAYLQERGRDMVRPLYRDSASNYEPDSSHAGLWYDKFCDKWQSGWTLPAQQKAEWISQVANGRPIGDQSLIIQHVDRQKALVEKALNGACVQLHSESRFVTGLGQEHPVENGFAWHSTLGIPYLPGSSIKGLIRAWACDWEDDQERKSQVEAILGTGETKSKERGKVGAVIIFDALPTGPVRLEADVMTPHYDNYYQKGLAPGDWISPVPIPFLVVAAGTPILFSFAPRTPAAIEHLPIVEDWLKAALQWLGAGAKTSVGYGRFAEASSEITASSAEAKTQTTAPQVQVQKPVDLPTPNKGTVEAVLLTEKTKKGGWKARHVATGISGPVQNTNEVPLDKQAGDTLSLIVASAKPSEIAFRYPTEAELQRAGRSQENAKSESKPNRKR